MTTGKTLVLATILLLLTWSGQPVHGVASPMQVSRWQPHDFAFQIDNTPEEPFLVPFSAEVTGPGGVKLTVPGFYDGDGTWKVRVSPTIEGDWSLVTQSDLPALNGRHAAFTSVPNPNPRVHGGLYVDPEHPRHFVFEDGTRFFLMGYECDWLWALDVGDPDLTVVNRFLDKLAANGFNYVLLNAYAHDTGWRKGKTGDDDYGPPPMYAWEGSNDQPDHRRLNLAYWRHYDRIMDALYQRGMIAHVMIKVYNKMVRWPDKGSDEDDLFFRGLIARYAAYPNVHWDFSKESNNEKDLDYKLGRIRFIRDNDPYHRPITTHTDTQTFNAGSYNEVLDYRSDQTHSKWHATILDHQQQNLWPVLNVEFGYEHGPQGPNDITYGVAQSPQEVCRRAWEIYMAGGYGAYYYTYTAWDVIRPEDTPPGYGYFKSLWDFFAATEFWDLESADELVSVGYCLANRGKEYVVFQNEAQAFSLTLDGLPGPASAKWFNPFTGEYQDAGTLTGGTVQLDPPPTWGRGPVALHVSLGLGPVASSNEVLRRFELSQGWKTKSMPPQASLTAAALKEAERAGDADGWLAAGAMPATVHDILLRQGKIEAPWLPGGTEKCFWVGEQDWVYAVRFVIEERGREAWLRFKGIENRVDVYLNGERVASHSGKLPLAVNVSGRLRPENSLVLHVHSDSRPGQTDSPARGHRSNSGSYLGPNPAISSVGVFDKVFVEISDGHLLKEIVTDVSLDETLTKGTVMVDAAGTSHLSSVEVRVCWGPMAGVWARPRRLPP